MSNLKTTFKVGASRAKNGTAMSAIPTAAVRTLSVVLLGVLVAGCARDMGPRETRSSFVPNYHMIRNPIEVGHKTYTVDLNFDSYGHLDKPSDTNLKNFLTRYHREGGYGFNAMVPSGPYHETAVSYLNNLLTHMGYGGSHVNISPYVSHNPTAIRLHFQSSKVTAHAQGCDALNKPLTDNFSSITHDYFGCAMRNNVASMVADPNDFNQLHNMEAVSTKRRMKLIEGYENPQLPEPVELDADRKTLIN